MNRGLRARAARMWRDRRDDAGFTLTELMVSMAILGIVMVLVTGAVLLASSTSARVDAAAASQQQAHQAFDKLDRQVRWASAFSQPGVSGGYLYAEWLYTAGGTPVCNELRLNTTSQQLQQRSWTQNKLTTTLSGWQILASGVSAVDASTPAFALLPADSTYPLARLRIRVMATAGGAKGTDTATHDVTYTALNSISSTAATSVCTEGRTSA